MRQALLPLTCWAAQHPVAASCLTPWLCRPFVSGLFCGLASSTIVAAEGGVYEIKAGEKVPEGTPKA